MHRTRHAVMKLDVELGEFIFLDDASLVQIAKRGLIDNVAHSEALDRFVLRRLAAAAVTDDLMSVVTTMAITPVVTTLDSHFGGAKENVVVRGMEKRSRRGMSPIFQRAEGRGSCSDQGSVDAADDVRPNSSMIYVSEPFQFLQKMRLEIFVPCVPAIAEQLL